VQTVSPQVGSLYGSTDVYVQGEGFDNSTTVSFTDGSNSVPCTVVSAQANQIHCQTQPAAPSVVINSDGVDPTYGRGFAWSPQSATVQQGAIVEWQWGLSELLTTLSYKVQQVTSGYSITPTTGGFDSGNATASGKNKQYFSFEIELEYSIFYLRIFHVSISNNWNILLLVTSC
jgi:hypothetical protein